MRLLRVEQTEKGPKLYVAGADLMDGTPIYDMKPYIPVSDCHPEASEGYTSQTKVHALQVEFPGELLSRYPEGEAKSSDRRALSGSKTGLCTGSGASLWSFFLPGLM